jgi:uncharacterized membrane protein YeaQ/YmgE (transglycosylase-associated protein family)
MHILGIILIGLVVGILARIVTPGPNPRGIIVTIVIGIVGAVTRPTAARRSASTSRASLPALSAL